MAHQPTLSLLHTSLVPPAIPTHGHRLFLPSLDLLWRDIHYNQRVLFYESCPLQRLPSLLAQLKHGLSVALVHFYPWAGRLVRGEDGRFAVDCNDAGVEFVQASVDVPFDELAKTGFQFTPIFPKLAQWGDLHRSDRSDVPLLSVQVTKFLHGGIALGVSQNHVIADGHSLWHFMVSWSECARGVPVSKPPVHTRTLLKVENPSREKERLPWEPSSDPIELAEDDAQQKAPPKKEVLVERVFHFSAEMMRRLKSMAAEDGASTSTSFEALSAHLWKCTTRARRLSPTAKVHFVILINSRKRLVPPLPDSYFGNVIHTGVAISTAGEILEENFAATAARFSEAIKSSTDETLRGMMHWLELRDNRFESFVMATVGLLVASSPRFPVYAVDFGWGGPDAVRPARVGGEGEVCLFAGREGGGSVDVCLKLEEEVMERLEKDCSFLLP